jgi:RES domain-containing protein
VIAFRQVDARYPFLWEDASQPAGRWHAAGEGPAHYFADTPDGAWAEFLRHEEITDPADLETIRRQLWSVDIGDVSPHAVGVARATATGGPETYAVCQRAARELRAGGVRCIVAPSAALVRDGARGRIVSDGVRHATEGRDGRVIVLFGPPRNLVGWIAADRGGPAVDLLDRVHHYRSG